MIKSCKYCNGEFIPQRDSEFCSRKCLNKSKYNLHKEKYTCDVCSKDYVANKYNNNRIEERNVCSQKCRNVWRWKRDRKFHVIVDNIEYKKCSTCKDLLKLDKFQNDKSKWDNLYNVCRICFKKYHREVFSKTEKGILNRKVGKANRRIREKNAGKLVPETIKEVYYENIEKFGALTCVYCKSNCEGDWHLEHRIPVSKNGTNKKTNLAIACPPCNLSKGSLTDLEFINKFANLKITNGVEQ